MSAVDADSTQQAANELRAMFLWILYQDISRADIVVHF